MPASARTASTPPPRKEAPGRRRRKARPKAGGQPLTRRREDGWTPDRRRTFLEALSDGHTVTAACGFVGLSVASAYALRHRRGGEAFAVGWRGACLIARDRLSDELYSRAIDGITESVTRANGEVVTRHRYDNRLAMALLTGLDKLAEHPKPDHINPCDTTDPFVRARAAAADFDHYLSLVEAGCGARDVAEFVEHSEHRRNPQLPQLNDTQIPPSEYLSNDDAYVDYDDNLDEGAEDFDAVVPDGVAPAAFAPAAPAKPAEPDDPRARYHAIDRMDAPGPVWFNVFAHEWRTILPPPPDFDLFQCGDHGDRGYWRVLDRAERAMLDSPWLEEAVGRLIRQREEDGRRW